MRSSIFVWIGAFVMSTGVTATPTPKEDGRFHLLVGSEDGLYVHSINEKGAGTAEYLSTFNGTSKAQGLVRRAGEGPQCGGSYIDYRSWDGAIDGLITLCRAQNPARFKASISANSGSALAYGCNYGNGQECWGSAQQLFHLAQEFLRQQPEGLLQLAKVQGQLRCD
jgi:hypothetical protein